MLIHTHTHILTHTHTHTYTYISILVIRYQDNLRFKKKTPAALQTEL